MTHWNDGYVSDIAYEGGIYREQMPTHLDVACLVAGYDTPVQPGEPFTYCELGCGLGDTAMAVAAGNAQARVWGFDFNPAHIAHARSLAARTGLDNIVLEERSFEELANGIVPDLPGFDYVTLHGVWSWVSPANRDHIVSFLRKHLRPGGLVSVSYNGMPGWTNSLGIQRLLYEGARVAEGSSDHRFRKAFELVRQVVGTGGSAIEPRILEQMEKLVAKGSFSYLSHEYLNEYWRPMFFAEVSAALKPAKLSYIASATLLENYPQVCMRPDQKALVESLPAELQQTVQDYFYPRSFRRDVFVRGPRRLTGPAGRTRLGAQRLMLAVRPEGAGREIDVPVGKATLNEEFYGPALATLARGEISIGGLIAEAAPGTAPDPGEILGMLVGGRLAYPLSNPVDAASCARVRAYNLRRIALFFAHGEQFGWIVGAGTGIAMQVNLLSMLVYQAVAEAPDPDGAHDPSAVRADVERILKGYGMNLLPKNSDETLDLEPEIIEVLAKNVPIWRRAGAL